ncbi:MAG: response regulator [Flavisolibacter sp.]
METTRVIIADDSEIYRKGLEQILNQLPGIKLCAIATNGRELVEYTMEQKPAVVITDIQMPLMNGIEAAKIIRKEQPAARVVGLTMYSDETLIVQMLEAGAAGYLDKYSAEEYLAVAVATVLKGHYFYCPTTTKRLTHLIATAGPLILDRRIKLSETQLQVVRLVCQGRSSKEIATQLNLSVKTIETYRRRIQEKMGVNGMAGMVVYAMQNGLLE